MRCEHWTTDCALFQQFSGPVVEMVDRLYDPSGYLFTLTDKSSNKIRTWLLLTTDDFNPLSAMTDALGDLGRAAYDVAASHAAFASEASVGNLDIVFPRDSDDRGRGRADHLYNYTFADGTADVDRFRWHLKMLLAGRSVGNVVPVIGAVARRGESLIGREDAREELCELLKAGSVALLGPRKSGKTSLLFWLKDEPPSGFETVYINLERVADATSFGVELISEARQHPKLTSRLNKLRLGKVPDQPTEQIKWKDKLRDKVDKDWSKFVERAVETLQGAPTPLVILDEFGEFLSEIRGTDELEPFVDAIRKMANRPDFRVIITGSRNLEYLLKDLGLESAFSAFSRFALPPLDKLSAERIFMEQLRSQQIRPSQEVVKRAIELVGHQVPLYVQMIADAVLATGTEGDLTETQIVEDAYHKAILGHHGQAYFQDLEVRLKSYDDFREHRAGQQVLRFIAQHNSVDAAELLARCQSQGISEKQFEALMALLEEYFFVIQSDSQYSFQTPVLRDYALRFYPPSKF